MKVKYITDDGIEFENKKDANLHELKLSMQDDIKNFTDALINGHIAQVDILDEDKKIFFMTTHEDKNHINYLVQRIEGMQFKIDKDASAEDYQVIKIYNIKNNISKDKENQLKLQYSKEVIEHLLDLKGLSFEFGLYNMMIGDVILYIWGGQHLKTLLSRLREGLKDNFPIGFEKDYALNEAFKEFENFMDSIFKSIG